MGISSSISNTGVDTSVKSGYFLFKIALEELHKSKDLFTPEALNIIPCYSNYLLELGNQSNMIIHIYHNSKHSSNTPLSEHLKIANNLNGAYLWFNEYQYDMLSLRI